MTVDAKVFCIELKVYCTDSTPILSALILQTFDSAAINEVVLTVLLIASLIDAPFEAFVVENYLNRMAETPTVELRYAPMMYYVWEESDLATKLEIVLTPEELREAVELPYCMALVRLLVYIWDWVMELVGVPVGRMT